MGLEPTDLLHAMQALYQLSYAPEVGSTIPAQWSATYAGRTSDGRTSLRQADRRRTFVRG